MMRENKILTDVPDGAEVRIFWWAENA